MLPTTTVSLTSNVLFKKSRVDPDSIKLPDHSTNDEESSEPGNTETERRFKQQVKDKIKAFSEHKINDRGLVRLRNSILEAMCELNQLEVEGSSKEELVELLLEWVSIKPQTYPDTIS